MAVVEPIDVDPQPSVGQVLTHEDRRHGGAERHGREQETAPPARRQCDRARGGHHEGRGRLFREEPEDQQQRPEHDPLGGSPRAAAIEPRRNEDEPQRVAADEVVEGAAERKREAHGPGAEQSRRVGQGGQLLGLVVLRDAAHRGDQKHERTREGQDGNAAAERIGQTDDLRESGEDRGVQGRVEEADEIDAGLRIERLAPRDPQRVCEHAAFHPLEVERVAESRQEHAGESDEDEARERDERQVREMRRERALRPADHDAVATGDLTPRQSPRPERRRPAAAGLR